MALLSGQALNGLWTMRTGEAISPMEELGTIVERYAWTGMVAGMMRYAPTVEDIFANMDFEKFSHLLWILNTLNLALH